MSILRARSDCEIVDDLFLFKYLSQIANNLIIGDVSFRNDPEHSIVITDLQFTSLFRTIHATESLLNQGLCHIFVSVYTDGTMNVCKLVQVSKKKS